MIVNYLAQIYGTIGWSEADTDNSIDLSYSRGRQSQSTGRERTTTSRLGQ